eukprot:COSAG01_NODE_1616_length_9720_cov_16.818314_8_plen_139_part_00
MIQRIGHADTTNSQELDRVGRDLFKTKWLAVVPRDKVPARKKDSYLICNLDDSGKQTIFHWVCRYVTKEGEALWHDPLGESGADQASELVKQVRALWTDEDNFDDPSHQADAEDNCGQRCLAALRIAKEMGPDAYMSL